MSEELSRRGFLKGAGAFGAGAALMGLAGCKAESPAAEKTDTPAEPAPQVVEPECKTIRYTWEIKPEEPGCSWGGDTEELGSRAR